MRRILLCLLILTISAATFDLGAAAELPASAMLQGVVGHPQSYSLSCESRSAVDWAAYWGVSLTESEFLASLPRSDNPDAGFVGDPSHVWGNIPPASYGVHARPIAALLRKAGLQAKARQNMSWKNLRAEIAAGRPVIVWVIGQMLSGIPIQYTASDGHTSTVAHFEHTMIVVGYGPDEVHVVDAYTGQFQTYWRESFMSSWRVLGRMAVTGGLNIEPAPTATAPAPVAVEIKTVLRLPLVYRQTAGQQAQPTPEPAPKLKPVKPKTYTVQPGDYLNALALQFGLDWRTLADLNGIGYPYIIYPGQVLKLR
jgi:uncharacterized protein YvpB/LysM repeat protein